MKATIWRPRAARIASFMLGLLFLAAGPFSNLAMAHNRLLKTEPAAQAALKTAPARVQFWFFEKPDLKITKITVKGPAGAVDVGPAHAVSEKVVAADFKGKLPAGAYTVNWQTAGDDGHVSKGEFGFTVAAQ
jgi:methionine-rich copper-binding protein CopC